MTVILVARTAKPILPLGRHRENGLSLHEYHLFKVKAEVYSLIPFKERERIIKTVKKLII